jgi:hypothetical protein
MSRNDDRRPLLSRAAWYGLGIGLFSAASIWILIGLFLLI